MQTRNLSGPPLVSWAAWTFILLVLAAFSTPLPAIAIESDVFVSGRADFALIANGVRHVHKISTVTLLPSEELFVTLEEYVSSLPVSVTAPDGPLESAGKNAWRWRTPSKPGLYSISVRNELDKDAMKLAVFVLHPVSEVRDGRLNGYTIGAYPETSGEGGKAFVPPRGFIEVTQANEDSLVSPHFHLKQFLCKQPGAYPKYVALDPKLLVKLELVLERLNKLGHRADSLFVMSGFRTPAYNAGLENVSRSRHILGGAADVYVDVAPEDGVMDDLNKDGSITVADAKLLFDIVAAMETEPWFKPHLGGLGLYTANAAHGPFVHIDARGASARW